jgi:predicted anti-sigma-YlaC factor YlaD
MVNDQQSIDRHVGEQLSGYIDGELTQQERQRVDLHCEQCENCRQNLAELRALRDRIGETRLSVIGEDKWREKMQDSGVRTSQSIGWMLFITGVLIAIGAAIIVFLAADDMPTWTKVMFFAIYGGLAVLLYSVLRQRLIERKTDKYKDVEI